MPISATTARAYLDIPDAHTLGQTDLDAMYTAIKAAKIKTVRIHAPWATVQPTNATTYTWVAVDRAINRALLKGITPILVLTGPLPGWLTTTFGDNYDVNLYAGYAKTVANRYKPGGRGITRANRPKGVNVYQIWDTPNVNPGTTYLLPSRYTKLLKTAQQAIRKTYPAATVMLAALEACKTKHLGLYRATDPVDYLRAIYRNGGKTYFDIAAYNPLTIATAQVATPPPPSATTMIQSDAFRTVMTRNGDKQKKMHWSSIGYDTNVVTELEQACYLETLRRFAEQRKDYLTGIGVYTYQDTGGS